MFCSKCGKEIDHEVKFCPNCGNGIAKNLTTTQQNNKTESYKSRTVAVILALFLGAIGVHRFYVGKVGSGVLMLLLSLCSFFIIGEIWALIDLIVILCGNFTDKDGLLITNWDAKY